MQEFFTLQDINAKTNPREIGLRGAMLGDLYNAGFPVQEGFVIGSALFREFVVLSGIREKLFVYLQSGKKEKIHEMILRKNVPEIEEKIIAECKKQGMTDMFLQSSCVFKDHKFVVTSLDKKTVMDGVKKCWASVFCNSFMDKLNSKNLFSAVIVQTNLAIRKSGFLYTQHPTRGGSLVVEVVKPKRYYFLVNKENWEPVHLQEFNRLDSPLTSKEKENVGKLGKNIEAHYGHSAKVHWVLSNRMYITGFRELNEKDKNYFASQVASSELRSSS